MDYEKKYKEALGWMQSLYNGLHGKTKEEAEKYFPELKESEDERMINELIIGFYAYRDQYPNFWKLRTDEIIEWLKKKKDEHTTDNGRFPFRPQELRELHTQGRCMSEEQQETSERLRDEQRYR